MSDVVMSVRVRHVGMPCVNACVRACMRACVCADEKEASNRYP